MTVRHPFQLFTYQKMQLDKTYINRHALYNQNKIIITKGKRKQDLKTVLVLKYHKTIYLLLLVNSCTDKKETKVLTTKIKLV